MDAVITICTQASVASSNEVSNLQNRLRKALRGIDFGAVLRCCVDRALLPVAKDEQANRLASLFCCTALMTDKYLGDVCGKFMVHLCQRSRASEKTVRHRACQWLHLLLTCMDGQELDSDECELAMKALLPRLNDKAAVVRVWAIQAASKLAVFDDKGVIAEAILRLMESDSNKEVRIAAINAIFLDGATLPAVVERVKDVR